MHLPHVGQSQPLPQSHLFPAGQTTFFLLDFKRGRGGVGLTSGRFGFGGVGGGVVRLVGAAPANEENSISMCSATQLNALLRLRELICSQDSRNPCLFL